MNPGRRLDDSELWLEHARADLSLARSSSSGKFHPLLAALRCFHAQQAAEKAIKALCLHRKIEFPYVHDLSRLLQILERQREAIPEDAWEAETLSQYAVETRYPFIGEPVTEEELSAALRIAERILLWVEAAIDTEA